MEKLEKEKLTANEIAELYYGEKDPEKAKLYSEWFWEQLAYEIGLEEEEEEEDMTTEKYEWEVEEDE